jgi:hypothetical protein
MIAAGWNDAAVADAVGRLLRKWHELLVEVAEEAEHRFGTLGPLSPRDLAHLVGTAFLGTEQLILPGKAGSAAEAKEALHRVTEVIRRLEEAKV